MKHVVQFPLRDGGTVFAEVESSTPDELIPAALPGEVAAKVSQTLESALDSVRPAATAVMKMLREIADSPDEIEIEFGIKLSARAGALLASADGEANYKVKLSWKSAQRGSSKVHGAAR